MATTTRVKCVLCDKRVPRDETKPTPIEVKGKQRRICKECDKAFERQGVEGRDVEPEPEYCPNCDGDMDGPYCTFCSHENYHWCSCPTCCDDDWDDEDWGY